MLKLLIMKNPVSLRSEPVVLKSKLKKHGMFFWCAGRHMIVLCTFDLERVSTGRSHLRCLLNMLFKKYEKCNCSGNFRYKFSETYLTTALYIGFHKVYKEFHKGN